MSNAKKKSNFFESEEGIEFEQALRLMALDDTYNTAPSYSPNSELYKDHLKPFVDKHMDYISAHPSINPQLYISNLRLMTRIK